MIARHWSARTTPQNWPAYEKHFIDNVLPELRGVSGFVSAQLLKRPSGEEIEIVVITLWRSMEAIETFAGPDRETAVVAPEAAALLTSFDRHAVHYELAVLEFPQTAPYTP